MRIAYTARFIADIQRVERSSKRDEILDAIELLPFVPEMGSTRLPESIVEEFGPQVRKLVVKPFIVLYELREDAGGESSCRVPEAGGLAGGGSAGGEGLIVVYGLVHSRLAH